MIGYKNKDVKVTTFQTNHNFDWPDQKMLLLTNWNPICLNFDSKTGTVGLFIHGQDVLQSEEYQKPKGRINLEAVFRDLEPK